MVRAYQTTCAEVIQRFDGHIAQYLGDGLLVYFGYPQAHEDDAQRAVRAGLGIVEAMEPLNARLEQEHGRAARRPRWASTPGWWWWATMGGGGRQEQLALGETPNIAARLQGLAAPDTVVISAATLPAGAGLFCLPGPRAHRRSKAWPRPCRCIASWRRAGRRVASTWLTAAGLTPLVGREQEVRLLLERWAQSQEGMGRWCCSAVRRALANRAWCEVLQEQRRARAGPPDDVSLFPVSHAERSAIR